MNHPHFNNWDQVDFVCCVVRIISSLGLTGQSVGAQLQNREIRNLIIIVDYFKISLHLISFFRLSSTVKTIPLERC